MSVAPANLKLLLPSVVGASLAAPANIGDAKTATQITGASIGELLFAMAANPAAGGDKIQYQKCFQGNDSATDLTAAVMWLNNAMDQGSGNHVTTAVSSSEADGSNVYLRVIGNNATPADALEEFAMNGTVTATGTTTFSKRHSITLHSTATNALTPAVGTITIYHNGTVIAIIPPGAYSCTGEIDIGLAATLDDTATAADAGTAPAGITFTRPRTSAAGIAVANSGVLTSGTAQGFWIRWTCAEARRASADVELYPLCMGDTV